MKKKLPVKCKAYKGQWCLSAMDVFQFHDPVSKGLVITGAVDRDTYARGFGMLYRLKANGASGWLNFCPFCGANVQKRTRKTKAKK